MSTPLNIPLPTVGLLPILEPQSMATYPRWRETGMKIAEDYGFADYLHTPLDTTSEEEYLKLPNGLAKALRAKQFFQAYLHKEFETMYIGAYVKLNARQILEKLDNHFYTYGYDELLNAAEEFDALWSSADSLPPTEFARKLINILGLFSYLKAPVDKKFTLALLGHKIGRKNPEWLYQVRNLFYEKQPDEWMTPHELVRHINGNLGKPVRAVEPSTTPAVVPVTVKKDSKKKKKKIGNCPRHPRGVHDDEECREHPDKRRPLNLQKS
ncbi:hypothetical protein CFO_g5237 [Ceratocystis platani]|uniref:Uncharacterized protein n=1 Tax=Ceratocystis fimbriata f. sp. platani TaxID=88771 RepID=A0A0F8AWR6_CERFI|nr:hypothetical protein CFO_g5237 [Ceratocystis platani]